jgi:hypothetical protein
MPRLGTCRLRGPRCGITCRFGPFHSVSHVPRLPPFEQGSYHDIELPYCCSRPDRRCQSCRHRTVLTAATCGPTYAVWITCKCPMALISPSLLSERTLEPLSAFPSIYVTPRRPWQPSQALQRTRELAVIVGSTALHHSLLSLSFPSSSSLLALTHRRQSPPSDLSTPPLIVRQKLGC